MERTISGMIGKGSVNHNTRAFTAKNVDKERSRNNVEFCHSDIREAYHQLFDGALERYNAKQKRNDRKIENYYEKIRQGKQEKLFHEIIRNTETVIGQLSDSSGLEKEREKLEQEMAVLAEMVQNCVAENARTAMNQGKYQERYSGLAGRYETLKKKHDKVSGEITARAARSQVLAMFLETLKKNGVVEEFDEVLWGDMVEHVTVDCKKKMVFTFKNGVEITI